MGPSYNIWSFVGVAGLLVALTQAVPHAPHHGANLHRRADPDRLVFCHFMVIDVPTFLVTVLVVTDHGSKTRLALSVVDPDLLITTLICNVPTPPELTHLP